MELVFFFIHINIQHSEQLAEGNNKINDIKLQNRQ